jgi:hypothetical protein
MDNGSKYPNTMAGQTGSKVPNAISSSNLKSHSQKLTNTSSRELLSRKQKIAAGSSSEINSNSSPAFGDGRCGGFANGIRRLIGRENVVCCEKGSRWGVGELA